MPNADQSLKYFKGDHVSAKMFRAEGAPFARTIPVFDAALTTGSSIIESATANFKSSWTDQHGTLHIEDIGSSVIVHAPAFGGAAHKSTIAAIIDGTHATMAGAATVDLSGARADIGPDETDVLLATLIPAGSNGAGCQRIIPSGCYLVRPGDLIIPNPQSGILRGQGSRFNSIIRSIDPDSALPVLTLGNGTFEPHSWVMEHLTISKGYGPGPALYLNRLNIIVFRDVIITDLGVAGIGIDTPAAALLFGEMIFDHVSVYGGDGLGSGTPPGSIGMRIHATSNCTFTNCNIEAVDVAFVFTGVFTQCRVTMTGGHIETTGYHALILNNCQPTIDMEVHTGDVWLGNDVVNGSLILYNNAPSWANGGLVDNGFGNRIRRVSTGPLNQSGGIYNAGVSFDGDEWLRVPSLCQDPLWLYGTTGWTGTNATASVVPVSMPGTKYGRALAVVDGGSGGGYVGKTFTAAANTDYLLQIGILEQKGIEHRIEVRDGSGTVWDSGVITSLYTSNDSQTIKVIRQRIPVTADTVFTVRLYSPAATKWAIYPMLLISRSAIRGEVDYISTGTGFSSSGSGVTFSMTQDLSTGTVYSFKFDPHYDLRHRGRSFFRAVVDCPSGTGGGRITVGGGFGSPETGPQITLREGSYEYIVPLMTAPVNSVVVFGGFVPAALSVEISDVGLFHIADNPNVVDYLKISGREMEAIDSAGNIHLPATTNFADEDRLLLSNLPADGTIKSPNILGIPAVSFGANQGLIAALNSKLAAFPNYVQTSRIYAFTASASTNRITIALDGYHYEGLNVPFNNESFVVMTSTAAGLTAGVNYWTKYISGVDYELYDDAALTSLADITSDGSGTMSQSPYAMFLQLAAGLFGVGFGDATNAGGVDPWTGDPYNVSAVGPPFLVASRHGTSAVKETAKGSGVYTGYPVFPMWDGGGGIFFCSGDPTGSLLWDGLDYPPLGSWVMRGDGKFSVRVGPIPEPDDGTGWVELTSQFWSLYDANTILTAYKVKMGDGSTRNMFVEIVPKTTQAKTDPLLRLYDPASGTTLQVNVGGAVGVPSLGVGYGAPQDIDGDPLTGEVHVSNFVGIGTETQAGTEKLSVNGTVRLPTLTASRPVKLTSANLLEAALIDLGVAADVAGTGLSSGDLLEWDGSKVAPSSFDAADVLTRLGAAETAISNLQSGKSDVGHTHNTSIPTHNHGGAVPADGGGTFSTI